MLELYLQPVPFTILCLVIGLLVGSFLNVVIYRVPKMMESEWQLQCAELRGETPVVLARFNLLTPRSHCPHCAHPIGASENIPVLSWLVLGGRCRACRAPISSRYPLVEALTGLLSAYAAWHFGPGWQAIGAILFIWALIALTCIDLDTQYLPDSITLPLLWLGLAFNLTQTFVPLETAVIGAMAGYLSLWLIFWGFKLATGKEGMGYGDFKLLAAIGALLGWKMLPLVILFSSLVGAVVGIALILFRQHGRDIPIPFGPYLTAAGVLALFWGEAVTREYLRMM